MDQEPGDPRAQPATWQGLTKKSALSTVSQTLIKLGFPPVPRSLPAAGHLPPNRGKATLCPQIHCADQGISVYHELNRSLTLLSHCFWGAGAGTRAGSHALKCRTKKAGVGALSGFVALSRPLILSYERRREDLLGGKRMAHRCLGCHPQRTVAQRAHDGPQSCQADPWFPAA